MAEYRVFGSVVSEDAAPGVNPLPWRHCAALMVLASIGVYALGYLVVAGFDHLFQYLQL